MKSIQLEWNDVDYKNCSTNYEGFNFIKKEYGLIANVILEQNHNGWPEVKLHGAEVDIKRFLKEQYGIDDYNTINEMIGDIK